jgi:uridine phosphorylase
MLRFGPLPSSELAACADGELPIVRVGSTGAIRGLDAAGTVIWTTEAFSPAVATTDQDDPIAIRVARI